MNKESVINNLATLAFLAWFFMVTGVSGYVIFDKISEKHTQDLAEQVSKAFQKNMAMINSQLKNMEQRIPASGKK